MVKSFRQRMLDTRFEEKYLTLLSPSVQDTLASIEATVKNLNDRFLSIPSTSASIPTFLEEITQLLDSQTIYFQKYGLALNDLRREGGLSLEDYQEARKKINRADYAAREESITVKLGKRIIMEDMTQVLKNQDSIHIAYAAAVDYRPPVAVTPRHSVRSDRRAFRRKVLNYYDAKEGVQPRSWCHILGRWVMSDYVRVAHLVPGSVDGDSLAYLFDGEVDPLSDIRNSLLMERHFASRMDDGDIAIVPVAGEDDEWQCVVTRPDKMNDLVYDGVRLKDIHGKRLSFRSTHRPAKRYLFFRFITTYLARQLEGDISWAEGIEQSAQAWETPGGYVRRSALEAFAKDICGESRSPEILEIYKKATFSDGQELSPAMASDLRLERTLLTLTKLTQRLLMR
ncbi:hypothetical protein FQN54_001504 [Arachnomyces sp. PD_36]|nr:hypothetical protein FQN54_001504 [Arachnomyces sp. PD_36]